MKGLLVDIELLQNLFAAWNLGDIAVSLHFQHKLETFDKILWTLIARTA